MNTLFIEPFSGVSGDMFLGALCGLADDYQDIIDLPRLLGLPDGEVRIQQVSKNGIVCRQVKIIDRSSDHHHRHLADILKIIDEGSISEGAKAIARKVFLIIGQAESTIHGMPVEKIHFHEVSGIDSILDIVGSAVLLDKLNIERTFSSPVCTGYGMVKTQHGLLPVPAPATAEILKGMPSFPGNEEGEKATPTGAAILKFLNPDFSPPPLTTQKIAYGPGATDFIYPNVLRLSFVTVPNKRLERDQMYVVEANIDDSPAEYLGNDFQYNLLNNGATDFYFTPVQMKKGRPGLKLTVLVAPGNLTRINEFILENTSTIGLRHHLVNRDCLTRKTIEVDTKYGKIKVKEVTAPSGQKRHKIEYESIQELSRKNGIGITQLKSELYQKLFEFFIDDV